MRTSELESILQGDRDWRSFSNAYGEEKSRMLSRIDGAVSSAEVGLLFDVLNVVVTRSQIENLCSSVIVGDIDPSDAQFIANLIALSGFDFDADSTEEAVMHLSAPNQDGLEQIYEVINMLSARDAT